MIFLVFCISKMNELCDTNKLFLRHYIIQPISFFSQWMPNSIFIFYLIQTSLVFIPFAALPKFRLERENLSPTADDPSTCSGSKRITLIFLQMKIVSMQHFEQSFFVIPLFRNSPRCSLVSTSLLDIPILSPTHTRGTEIVFYDQIKSHPSLKIIQSSRK